MGILDPIDKNRLFAIDSLRKFVEDEEDKYIEKLQKWKKIFQKDEELSNPRLLAASLTGYLMMYDEKLRDIMWNIWKNDELRISEFYDIIGKYFVDREAET